MAFSVFPWEYFFEELIMSLWCCWLCLPLVSASTVNLATIADFDLDPSSQPQCQWKFSLFSLPFLLPKGTLALGTCSLHLLPSPYFCLLLSACSVHGKPQFSSYQGFLQSPENPTYFAFWFSVQIPQMASHLKTVAKTLTQAFYNVSHYFLS